MDDPLSDAIEKMELATKSEIVRTVSTPRVNRLRSRVGYWAILALFLLARPLVADAGLITVGVAGGPGLPNFTTPSAADLPSGNQVQIGFFDSGFNFSMSDDLGALQAAWNPFGQLGVTSIAGQDGRISGTIDADDAGFVGEQIFMFAFQTSGDVVPDTTWSNVQSYGIFTNTSSGAWVFPDGDSSQNYTSVSTDTVSAVHWGSIVGSTSLQLGSTVPEVSPAWICAFLLGVAGLLKRRRHSGDHLRR